MSLKLYQIVILLSSLFATTIIFPQPKKILIIAEAGKLPDDSMIHLAGNSDDMGNWNEMLPMKKESNRRWSFETTAETGDTL